MTETRATGANRVSISLPAEGYANVARLVTGGFTSSLALGFDATDDLQQAIELVLRLIPSQGRSATVALVVGPDGLTVTLGSFAGETITRQLQRIVRDGLDLETVLGRLVDRIEVVDGSSAALVLHRSLEATTG